MSKRIAALILCILGSCVFDRPQKEHIPWFWNRAEYGLVANGREVTTCLFGAEWASHDDGRPRLVLHDRHIARLWDMSADTHVTVTCVQDEGSGFLAFALNPLSIRSRAVFSGEEKIQEYRTVDVDMEDELITYSEGAETFRYAVPPEALIEPTVRVLIPTLPRTVGAQIVVPITYYDWMRHEVSTDQKIVFMGWSWTAVRGQTLYLARFDRVEGDDVAASYWVDADNRLVMTTAGPNAFWVLKR